MNFTIISRLPFVQYRSLGPAPVQYRNFHGIKSRGSVKSSEEPAVDSVSSCDVSAGRGEAAVLEFQAGGNSAARWSEL